MNELKQKYDSIYAGDETEFWTVNSLDEELAIRNLVDWTGLRVLEIGCGQGRLASMIAMSNAMSVDGIDYSSEAIKRAAESFNLPNLKFRNLPYDDEKCVYDAVVMQGVLEHQDDPWSMLREIIQRSMRPGGILVTSSPAFINPRGYIWMTLQTLLGVPMSLTDKHFINPWDVENFCDGVNCQMSMITIHQDWSSGDLCIKDFRRRLVNAMNDAGIDNSNVPQFLSWLQKALKHDRARSSHSGAIAIYRITKR